MTVAAVSGLGHGGFFWKIKSCILCERCVIGLDESGFQVYNNPTRTVEGG